MKWVVLVLCIFLLGCIVVDQGIVKETETIRYEIGGGKMKLNSAAFENGDMIPAKYTCQGEDINPQLSWDDVPEGTKSFALIIDDPDAPSGLWVHWLVKDIPADVKEIAENSVSGTQVINDFGKEAYGGPCPPSGVHRYFFKLYALDVDNLDADNKGEFYKQVGKHKIEEAVLIGKYTKS